MNSNKSPPDSNSTIKPAVVLKISMSAYLIQRRLLLLLCLLLHLNSSLAYSLKGCVISYSEDASADVSLDCSGRELVTVPDDIPRDASSVKLSNNQLEQINRQDFGHLSKLRNLFLDSNQIAHVDDGSFINLVALTNLYMNDNNLTRLTGNIFQGLSNLTTLDLGGNNIQFIHSSAFQFLSSLQTVILKDNKLQQVTDIQPILQLPHLQELNIRANLFTSFQTKDLLLNMSSGLKKLDVSDNAKLEKFSITTQIFPHLEMIDLSGSGRAAGLKWDIPDKTLLRNITQLDFSGTLIPFEEIQKVLQSLDSLMHLRLSYMETFIQKGLLATVCKILTLRRLDLLYNSVPKLSSKLVTCSQLNELDLSNTNTSELPKGSMRLMKSLRSLTLDFNFLTKVPDDIRSLSSLEVLRLSANRISELTCEDFINTTRLTELYLDKNRIAKLDRCVFENLNDLKVLDMSNNLLWTFGGAFKTGLQKLEFLNLNKNFISTLEKGDFKGLGSLKYLDLASKHIGSVKSNAFDGLNNLRTLQVSLPLGFENKFRGLQQLENLTVYFDIDSSFKSPHSNFYKALFHLKSLKLFTIIYTGDHSGFPFEILMDILQAMKHLEDFTAENLYISAPRPDTFMYNSQLKRLTISQTDLSDLGPELFQPIPNLQALDLSYSKLKSLDFLAQADLSALTFLKLSDNDITVINETVFQSLPALTYLDLDNNPFTCDCSNAGFIQWVKNNNQTQVVNAHMYTCSFPVVEQGNKLLDFDIQSCWMDVGFLCFICSTCLTLLTLLAAFVFHFLRWQLAYAYYLFLAFLYDSRKRKKNGAPHQYDAFISYNVHDEAWVYREMLPVLEGEQGWRLCLHHRDFQPGKPIMDNITDAIYGSRKTICVISQRYLQSEWCSREIQMASFRLFDEHKDVLILLFLEEIPAQRLSPYYRMRKLVKGRTYLSWPQAGQHKGVFWQNVSRALETGDAPTETADLLTGPAGC
ncbi:toll-like receptor 13 [Micropterus dolomieu]|uniref:toll-like receptor 13 n=1 Tax=Micropterus dolomieu TaxID=147949 RepID=UPI001E8D63BC|nr:toll-like receptor 13 [Micropterus dolomieu]XP_045914747.1 toll-like receptor 13 [Micropterus dolomieu]